MRSIGRPSNLEQRHDVAMLIGTTGAITLNSHGTLLRPRRPNKWRWSRAAAGPWARMPLTFAYALAAMGAGCSKNNEIGVLVFPTDAGAPDMAVDEPQPRICRRDDDGSCIALTPDTSCVPFIGSLYDPVADCVSPEEVTLYCAASSPTTMSALGSSSGCFNTTVGGIGRSYWTANTAPADQLAADHACTPDTAASIAAAPRCRYPNDAGPDAPAIEYACASDSAGACHPTTANTTCTAFTGRRYDQAAGCISPSDVSLYCGAFPTGAPGGFAPVAGCYVESSDDGATIYWTINTDPGSARAATHACDKDTSAAVSRAPACH